MSDRPDTKRPWHGPHRPEAETVTAVLSAQCPHMLVGPVRYLSEGWDFTAFDVGDAFVARFPKRDAEGDGDARFADRVRFHATRWLLHQVKTAEDGWKTEDRGR